ncbi:hypothetical protein AVEN_17509-1, partial [Araneus ventricosus]
MHQGTPLGHGPRYTTWPFHGKWLTTKLRNESNFHILYYVFEGLKNEKRLAEFGLDKLSAMRYLPMKATKNVSDLIAGYKSVYQSLRVLSFTEE